MKKIVLPELGEGIDKATVSYWLVDIGKEIKEGDEFIEMATDKAVFNVPSPFSGVLKEKVVDVGVDVKVGDTLAILE